MQNIYKMLSEGIKIWQFFCSLFYGGVDSSKLEKGIQEEVIYKTI